MTNPAPVADAAPPTSDAPKSEAAAMPTSDTPTSDAPKSDAPKSDAASTPMSDAPPPQVWPTLRARDARGLIRFLVDVVGFREAVVYGTSDVVDHAQLAWPDGGGIMLGTARTTADDQWPLQPGTFGAYVVTTDPEGLYARVVAGGADITQELHDTDYGSRDFALRDPEGNRWSFGSYRGEPTPS